MDISIYILSGIIIGLIIGYFLWRAGKTISRDIKEHGIIQEQSDEKEKNLQKIREYISNKDKVTNNDIESFLKVSNATATRYLDDLEKKGLLKQVGETGKYTYYQKV